MARKTITAILVCAVMVLVAAVPLAMAGTHLVTKGEKGPNNSAVTWEFLPPALGNWTGKITNTGLRWMVVDVYDSTMGAMDQISHQRIRFAAYLAYPNGEVVTNGVPMKPTHTYSITVTPNGPRGSTAIVEDVFIPYEPPVASFSYLVTGPTVAVDGSASSDLDGTVVTWDWDWDDGTTGTGEITSHTYTVTGDYDIVLTVTDNDGLTDSLSQSVHVEVPIVVDDPPVAAFTWSVLGATVTVDGSTSSDDHGVVSWTWVWGDGSLAGSGKIATHEYKAPGTYTITLTVADVKDQKDSISHDVPIADNPPVAAFTWSVLGATVSVDATGSTDDWGIASYAWDFGDSTSGTGMKTTHTYTESGTYPVTLTVTDTKDQTNSVSHDVSVVVDNPPVAAFTYTSTSWTLSVDATTSSDDYGIASYAWDFGDGTTGTGMITTHKYTASNTYNVKLTVTDTVGQTNSLIKPIAILDNPPVAAFTYTSTSWTLSVDATTSSDDFGINSYAWDFGDGTTGTGMITTHKYTASNTYNVKLTVTDTVGQTNSLTKPVQVVDNKPVAMFTWTANGAVVSFVSTSTDDYGIASYAWDFGDGTTGTGATPSHTYGVSPLMGPVLAIEPSVGRQLPPYVVSGQVYDSLGAVVGSATVTVLNTRTGVSGTQVADPDYGYYEFDLNKVDPSWARGDLIRVTAVKGTLSGSAEGIAGVGDTYGSLWLDITVHGAVVPHEFLVTLTVTDSVGQTNSYSETVTVYY